MKRILWAVFFLILTFTNVGSADTIQTWLGTGLNPVTTSLYPERDDLTKWRLVASGSQIPWSARVGFGVCVFQDKLWVVGGEANSEVWNTYNGTDWNIISAGQFPSNLQGFGLEVLNNEMWMLGSTVRHSSDGITWAIATTVPILSQRTVSSTVMDNKLWMMDLGFRAGGTTGIWASSDGVNWVCKTTGVPYNNSGQQGPKGGTFDGYLFYEYWINPNYGIYRSIDGIIWENLSFPTQYRQFSSRCQYGDIYFGCPTDNGIMRKISSTNHIWTVSSATTTPVLHTAAFDVPSPVDGTKFKGHIYIINSNGTDKSIYRSY